LKQQSFIEFQIRVYQLTTSSIVEIYVYQLKLIEKSLISSKDIEQSFKSFMITIKDLQEQKRAKILKRMREIDNGAKEEWYKEYVSLRCQLNSLDVTDGCLFQD